MCLCFTIKCVRVTYLFEVCNVSECVVLRCVLHKETKIHVVFFSSLCFFLRFFFVFVITPVSGCSLTQLNTWPSVAVVILLDYEFFFLFKFYFDSFSISYWRYGPTDRPRYKCVLESRRSRNVCVCCSVSALCVWLWCVRSKQCSLEIAATTAGRQSEADSYGEGTRIKKKSELNRVAQCTHGRPSVPKWHGQNCRNEQKYTIAARCERDDCSSCCELMQQRFSTTLITIYFEIDVTLGIPLRTHTYISQFAFLFLFLCHEVSIAFDCVSCSCGLVINIIYFSCFSSCFARCFQTHRLRLNYCEYSMQIVCTRNWRMQRKKVVDFSHLFRSRYLVNGN